MSNVHPGDTCQITAQGIVEFVDEDRVLVTVHGVTVPMLASAVQPIEVAEKKDTSPMIRSPRIHRIVRIEERNTPPSTLFDTTIEYPSDALPEWFAPLQPIIEDETFTSLVIYLGDGAVRYHITLTEHLRGGKD